MADDDFAVVIGINRYPKINDLKAPTCDAIRFYLWLRCPKGGNVPKDRIHLLLSPIRRSRWGKRPTNGSHVDPIFETMVRQAASRRRNGEGERLGRRFYLFLAGHGIEDTHPEKYPALLLANADWADFANEHIPGLVFAQALQSSGLFEEVVLFMDTCRGECRLAGKKTLFNFFPSSQNVNPKKFYGFAAQRGQPAREVPVIGTRRGRWTGRFSSFVLEGLRGLARDHNGAITGESLKKYVKKCHDQLVYDSPGDMLPYIYPPDFDSSDDDFIFSPAGLAAPVPRRIDLFVSDVGGAALPQLHLVSPDGRTLAIDVSNSKAFRLTDSALIIRKLNPGQYCLLSSDGCLSKHFEVHVDYVLDVPSETLRNVKAELYDPTVHGTQGEDT